MSLGIFSVYSHVLGMDVPLNVFLPERRKREALDTSGKKYPVLYLLHGHSDDQNAWMRKSNIELLIRDLEVVVVMPTVHRGFYTDCKKGLKYFTFIAEELPIMVRNMFHVSNKREETFVMGNSMGGYGAFKLALNYPDRYGAAASLSGGLEPYQCFMDPEIDSLFNIADFTANMRNVFGSKEDYEQSENDLCYMAKKLDEYEGPQPLLYQCCGTEDYLTYEQNNIFSQFVEKNTSHLNRVYSESAGGHDWTYWMPRAKEFIEMLNLRKIQ